MGEVLHAARALATMTPRPRTHAPTSLRWRTLLPAVATALVLVAISAVGLAALSSRHIAGRRLARARMLTHLIADVARATPDRVTLERLVRALGIEREIELIVVAAGNPPRVLASTRQEWVGRPVAGLGRPDLVTQLAAVRATHDGQHVQLTHADGVVCTEPLRGAIAPAMHDGVVVLSFNGGAIRAQVERWARDVVLLLALTLAAAIALAEVLLHTMVLRPIADIAAAAERRRKGERTALAPVHAGDEIGRLAESLNENNRAINDAARGLEYQLFVLDQATVVSVTDPQGRMLYVNDRFCALSGYTRDELVGRSHAIVNSGHHPPEFFADLWTTVLSGRVWHGEVRNRARDGSIYWVSATLIPSLDGSGAIERITGAYHDITDRKREEALARASEQRTRLVVDSALDAVVTIDERGFITGWNAQAERTFGWSAREVTGRALSELIIPVQFRRAHERGMDRFRRTGEGPVLGHRFEISALRRDGTEFPIEISISAMPGENGYTFAAFLRDIGDRKRAEYELVQAKEAAQSASRAKTEFLATMSHEIRTPMNGVIGFTDLLLDSPLDASQREYAETIRSSGVALLALIDDILDFSKIEAGRLDVEQAPFEARRAAADVVELLAAKAAERKLELVFDWPADVPAHVVGDSMRFRQVLLNLAGNAIKFTVSGMVTIRVARAEGDRLRFEVHDTGIGVAEEKLPALFRKFTQADSSTTRRFGGTGLGLAISKQLVEMMGGEIGAESRLGRGSTFWFTLPVGAPVTADPPEPAHPDVSGMRVLVVDDLEANRRVLLSQVQAWGVHASEAADGEAALAALRDAARAGTPFDAVLLDHRMPGMTGEELGAAIRSDRGCGRPGLVMLSSGAFRAEREQYTSAGFTAVLLKPLVRPELLQEALARIVHKQLGLGSSVAAGAIAAVPAAAPSAADEASATTPNPAPVSFPGVRVLVAEDQPVNQRLAARVLTRAGCTVDVAANGLEACEMAELHAYDIVFMDCHMPVRDGFEATNAIRAREREAYAKGRPGRLPIVALTASVLKADRERCYASGMDDFISKPFRPEQLHAALARWVRGGGDSERALREAA